MRGVHRVIKQWLYGPEPRDFPQPSGPPQSLRDASHRFNNEAAGLDAVFRRLRQYDDPLKELVRRISDEGERDGPAVH